MILKCENMKLGYGASMFGLTEVYLLILLGTQNIYAHPYRNSQNEKNAVNNEGRFQRDVWSYTDTDTSNGTTKILNSRIQQKGSSHRDRDRVHLTSDIVFPDSVNANRVPSCRGSTYCENVDSYPEDIVNRAIQSNHSLRALAATDEISIQVRVDDEDLPLCRTTETVIFPRSGENKDKVWKFIVNQENFQQGVRVEKCVAENESCQSYGGVAAGYKTFCKQKFVYRQLAAVYNGTVVPDTFLFPASCCCHATFTSNPLIRIDTSVKNSRSQIKSSGMSKKK